LAAAAREYDRVSDNGVRDKSDLELFNAVLLFLRTRVSAGTIRALYADAPGADLCRFIAVAYTADVYGRDVAHRLFSFSFDRATYGKIVWPRFDPANLPRIASGFSYGGFAAQRVRALNGAGRLVLPDAGRPPDGRTL
ncbi:MAG TPA: hypothetical protein VGL95_07815, partial [Acetobacteraceae bacterium]